MSLTCIATKRPPVALRDYKPGAWGLYARVIDQSKPTFLSSRG